MWFRNSCRRTAHRKSWPQALREVLVDSPLRRRQVEAFAGIDQIMSTGDQPPSARAADIVLATMRKQRDTS